MRSAGLVAYRALSDLLGKAAFFIVTILAARRLSQEGFGIFAIGTTIGWIGVVASDFGLQMHLARSVARAPESARHVLRRWLRVRLISAGGAFLVTALFAATIIGPRMAPAIVLFALGYLLAGLVEFLHYFYRGLGRSDLESTLTLYQRLGTLGCASAALLVRPDPVLLAAAMIVPSAVTAVYSLNLANRLAPADVRRPGPETADVRRPELLDPARQSSTREFIRDVAPIGAGILLSALYFRVDVFLLQAWQSTETVGLYNAVFRLIEALRLFPAALLAVALPVLMRATGSGPLIQVSAILTAFGLAAASALWVFADWLVLFAYGPAYADAVPAFRILAVAFPLMSLNYALTTQLIGWNGHRTFALLCLAALVFNVTLNARLIPALSLTGAAWTTLWTEALLTVGCLGALFVLARTKSRTGPASTPAMAVV